MFVYPTSLSLTLNLWLGVPSLPANSIFQSTMLRFGVHGAAGTPGHGGESSRSVLRLTALVRWAAEYGGRSRFGAHRVLM